jgi:protein-disulfide isomerase
MTKSARNARERAAAARREAQKRASRRRRWTVVAVIAVVLAVIVGGSVWLAGRDTTGQADSASAPKGAEGYGVVVGEADAPKTVVVYEDFQCPVCKAFEDATTKQVAEGISDGKVEVEYRIVSFLDEASRNNYSSRAANAAAAVLDNAGVDAFKEFHDTLYAHQPAENTAGLSNHQLIDAAVQAGADRSTVRAAIDGGEFDQWVVDATDAMSKDGVTGTPTIEIDGQQLDPQTGMQRLLALVQ